MFLEKGHDLVLTEPAAEDVAVAVHKYVLGDVSDIVHGSRLALPELEVGHLRPGQLVSLDGILPVVGIPVKRDTENLETLAVILLVDLHESRIEHTAGAAPSGPEIYHGHLVLPVYVGKGDGLAVGTVHREVDAGIAGLKTELGLELAVNTGQNPVGAELRTELELPYKILDRVDRQREEVLIEEIQREIGDRVLGHIKILDVSA